MTYRILLVDDDANQIHVVEHLLKERMHCEATVVETGQEAIDILTHSGASDYDLVLLDLSMPGVDGIKVLNAVKPMNPNLPVIVRTGYDDLDMAVEAMKAGATDFIKKLDDPERLQTCINNALRMHTLNDELLRLKRSITGRTSFSDVMGSSDAVKEMVSYGKKVAASNIPVLLEGESGSGKELMARAIHAASGRAEKPFIAVNCGAIPENLVESILFGHEKGAFTGAMYKTSGKFREATGGTIFLDEVGELPADVQVKLLRVLQDGEIDPVGSKKPIKVDVRVISATNRDLDREIKEGHFREDLYYRLNVFPIYIPPLRKRKSDIRPLMEYFLQSFSASEGKVIKGISEAAEEMLCNYSWPGNIRQLKNSVYRAVVLCEGEVLEVSDFPQVNNSEHLKGQQEAYEGEAFSARGEGHLVQSGDGHFRNLRDIEKDVITAALRHYHGRMSEVARRLGIGRSTLYRKISDLGIESGTQEDAS